MRNLESGVTRESNEAKADGPDLSASKSTEHDSLGTGNNNGMSSDGRRAFQSLRKSMAFQETTLADGEKTQARRNIEEQLQEYRSQRHKHRTETHSTLDPAVMLNPELLPRAIPSGTQTEYVPQLMPPPRGPKLGSLRLPPSSEKRRVHSLQDLVMEEHSNNQKVRGKGDGKSKSLQGGMRNAIIRGSKDKGSGESNGVMEGGRSGSVLEFIVGEQERPSTVGPCPIGACDEVWETAAPNGGNDLSYFQHKEDTAIREQIGIGNGKQGVEMMRVTPASVGTGYGTFPSIHELLRATAEAVAMDVKQRDRDLGTRERGEDMDDALSSSAEGVAARLQGQVESVTAEAKQAMRDKAELQALLAAARVALQQQLTSCQAATLREEAAGRAAHELEDRANRLEEDLQAVKTALGEAEGTARGLQADLAQSEEQRSRVETHLGQLEGELEEKSKEVSRLRAQADALRREQIQLHADKAMAVARLQSLTQELASALQARDWFREQLSRAQASRASLQQLLLTLQAEQASGEGELQDLREKNVGLSERLAQAAQQALRDRESLSLQLTAIEAEVREHEENIRWKTEQNQQKKELQLEVSVDSLKQHDLNQLRESEAALAQKDSEVHRLRQEQHELEQHLHEAEQKANDSENELHAMEARCREMESRCEDLHALLEGHLEQQDSMEVSLSIANPPGGSELPPDLLTDATLGLQATEISSSPQTSSSESDLIADASVSPDIMASQNSSAINNTGLDTTAENTALQQEVTRLVKQIKKLKEQLQNTKVLVAAHRRDASVRAETVSQEQKARAQVESNLEALREELVVLRAEQGELHALREQGKLKVVEAQREVVLQQEIAKLDLEKTELEEEVKLLRVVQAASDELIQENEQLQENLNSTRLQLRKMEGQLASVTTRDEGWSRRKAYEQTVGLLSRRLQEALGERDQARLEIERLQQTSNAQPQVELESAHTALLELQEKKAGLDRALETMSAAAAREREGTAVKVREMEAEVSRWKDACRVARLRLQQELGRGEGALRVQDALREHGLELEATLAQREGQLAQLSLQVESLLRDKEREDSERGQRLKELQKSLAVERERSLHLQGQVSWWRLEAGEGQRALEGVRQEQQETKCMLRDKEGKLEELGVEMEMLRVEEEKRFSQLHSEIKASQQDLQAARSSLHERVEREGRFREQVQELTWRVTDAEGEVQMLRDQLREAEEKGRRDLHSIQELRQDKTALAEELAATRKDKFVQQVRLRELQGSMKLLLRQNQDLRNGLQGKVELQPKQITQQDPQTSKDEVSTSLKIPACPIPPALLQDLLNPPTPPPSQPLTSLHSCLHQLREEMASLQRQMEEHTETVHRSVSSWSQLGGHLRELSSPTLHTPPPTHTPPSPSTSPSPCPDTPSSSSPPPSSPTRPSPPPIHSP